MARFYGIIGFSATSETAPGVWTQQVTERPYYGDTLQNGMRWDRGESINDNLTLNNRISVLGDSYAYSNFGAMKYVVYMGVKWKITSISVERPRIILSIGGVYDE